VPERDRLAELRQIFRCVLPQAIRHGSHLLLTLRMTMQRGRPTGARICREKRSAGVALAF
jgi:hypothetical protein